MPRATTTKLYRTHPEPIKRKGTSLESGESSRNPLFKTRQFGQHILKNPSTAQRIVDAAALRSSDHVLEIGPGTGNLTVRILEKAKHVTVIEVDPRMAAELAKRVQGTPEQKKLTIIVGDFVKADLPYFDICISNTPYQLSSHIIFRLLSHRPLFRSAILMFQREFAMRLIAQPSTTLWSRLSANVQLYASVSNVMAVSRNDFRPPPDVESSVIKLVPADPPPPLRFEEFDGLTRIVFSRPNKTIHGNLKAKGVGEMLEKNRLAWVAAQNLVLDPLNIEECIREVLDETGVREARAAKMTVNDLLKLLAAFHDVGIHFA